MIQEFPIATRSEALEQMQDFGLYINHVDVDTSVVRRCRWDQKKNNDGFYRLWSIDGDLVTGFFGKFCHGYEYHKITSTREAPKMSEAQRFQVKRKIEESREKIEKNFEPDLNIWEQATPCEEHDYLKNKGVSSYGLRQIKGVRETELLIPMMSKDDDLTGIQRIFPNGKKLMAAGSKKQGSFFKIEGSDTFALCEGYATGATIHEATGWTVIVCFDCGNLRKVARHFRTEKLIVCGDNDTKTDGNPGVTKAKEVGKIYFCPVVVPSQDNSDFNDVGLQECAKQLAGKEPFSFLEQIAEKEGQDGKERFILDRRTYLAQFPKQEFSFLKNRIKEVFNISKSFLDDAVKGIKSDEDLQIIEDAKAELEKVRYDGKTYHKLSLSVDGDKYYSTTQQEVNLLVTMAADESNEMKQKYLDGIHRDKVISEVTAESMPSGRSHIKEFLGADGSYSIKKMVSAEKCIESSLAELNEIEVNSDFISYINKNYPEVIDVIEASLARKFCESKKAFVYFKCPTSYGKTFFFGPDSLSRTFTKRYNVEEFRGNSPDVFIKPIFLFIDEANCFPSEYKVNEPEYKRLYGGFAKVKMGMRVMACANSIEDLERGVDPQIQERIVKIKTKDIRLDHCGIERTLSRKMWEKWILNKLANRLVEWASTGDIHKACESFFNKFLKKYDSKTEYVDLEEVLVNHMEELMQIGTENSAFKFRFSEHIKKLGGGKFFITSPSKVFKEVFMYFEEERYKAFKAQFKTVEEVAKMNYFEHYNAMKIATVAKRGLLFEVGSDGKLKKLQKQNATLQEKS